MADDEQGTPSDQAVRDAVLELADALERLTELLDGALSGIPDLAPDALIALPRIRLHLTQAKSLLA